MPVNIQPPPNPFLPFMYYRGGRAQGRVLQGQAIERRQAAERQMAAQGFSQLASFGSNLFMSQVGQAQALQRMAVGQQNALQMAGVENQAAAARQQAAFGHADTVLSSEQDFRREMAGTEQGQAIERAMIEQGFDPNGPPIVTYDEMGTPTVTTPFQRFTAANRERQAAELQQVQSRTIQNWAAAGFEPGIQPQQQAEIGRLGASFARIMGDPSVSPAQKLALGGQLQARMQSIMQTPMPVQKKGPSLSETADQFAQAARPVPGTNGGVLVPVASDKFQYVPPEKEKSAEQMKPTIDHLLEARKLAIEEYKIGQQLRTELLKYEGDPKDLLPDEKSIQQRTDEILGIIRSPSAEAAEGQLEQRRQQLAEQRARLRAEQIGAGLPPEQREQLAKNLYNESRAGQAAVPETPDNEIDISKRVEGLKRAYGRDVNQWPPTAQQEYRALREKWEALTGGG